MRPRWRKYARTAETRREIVDRRVRDRAAAEGAECREVAPIGIDGPR